jgi:hypothetical protein
VNGSGHTSEGKKGDEEDLMKPHMKEFLFTKKSTTRKVGKNMQILIIVED